MFYGSIVALVTPMLDDGTVDVDALRGLIEWHIENASDGIVVLGSTGEAATLTLGERALIIEQTLEQVKGRVPVIAGTGTNATQATIQLTQEAMDLGVDACLLVTPYYNKPTQEGLYQHYRAVAQAVAIPQILYNVPSRTACDLKVETVVRLAVLPNIVGLKEATGEIERVQAILRLCEQHPLDLFSGDDEIGKDFILAGGKGIISVTANVAPKLMHDMCAAALAGEQAKASIMDQKLSHLHKRLFVETNPIPVKWALRQMGKIAAGIRLPLTPLSANYYAELIDALHFADISLEDR